MEWFRKFLDSLSNIPNFWKKLNKNQKIAFTSLILAIVFALVVAVVLNAPKYVLLITANNETDAGAIIQQLESQGIPYKVEAGNRIFIPSSYNVYEVRMKLASSGILGASSKGFELLDQSSFGATSFDKQVNYQRALQGELERTIATINGVKYARVHLTLPKYTYYVRGEMAETRASVQLVLEPGATISKEQVKGIIYLLTGAVEGLKPENVKVVDNFGRALSDLVNFDENTYAANTKTELKMQLENYYRNKIQPALETVFGFGKVEVITDINLNWQKIEKTITTYSSPKGGLLRSKETETEKSTVKPADGGPVGTESNIPTTYYQSVEGSNSSLYEKSHEITNYELNQIVENVVQNMEGEIENISVSVIIDSSSTVFNTVSKDEINKLVSNIIQKSIAANASPSNISYSLAFIPFSRELEEQYQQLIQTEQLKKDIVFKITLLLIATVLMFFSSYGILLQIRKSKARKLVLQRYKMLEEEAQKLVEEEGGQEAEEILSEAQKVIEELKDYAKQLAVKSPEETAAIIKIWMSERG
ncbi:flagellar M-ring protein FliF [Thermosipho affectus]|uniref:Flagellar M-ring protein n=2 Tax=Thermosipho TaxID=2420 RepID=A0ABX3IK03_9BACT|nr:MULTISPECIES: flagellar basal-body MS-ring/collar protein FliF [Thermosipho]APT71948.1 flagellar M-ring protein FliF [Thermosipho sp. 1063]ONN27521.1 flagellar M-ring protein FliF [Thermosipho affectus]OOC44885.1 flagellar M-ring protein FliF [Thermosipho sp. 1074]